MLPHENMSSELTKFEADSIDGIIPDKEVDVFLNGFSANHDHKQMPRLREFTLKEWMDKSKPKTGTSENESVSVSEYIRSALSIALKLTECIIAGEDEEESGNGWSIPLTSINSRNVLVQVQESEGQGLGVVEYAWFTSCSGETSPVTSRLFAMGILFYELFFTKHLVQEDLACFSANNSSSLVFNAISLNNGSSGNQRPSKKSQRQLPTSDDIISQSTARLRENGSPSSLCDLIGHLLDCSNGDFSGDDAYASFADLKLDLQLMSNDPARFLDDIDDNPMQPLLVCNKLYGREDEIARVQEYYLKRKGVIVKGLAGSGKTAIALHVQELTNQACGYFTMTKFDQNKDVVPLFTIGSSVSELCDLFYQSATPTQMDSVKETLISALDNQAGLLAIFVPSLKKLMPVDNEVFINCVDSAAGMRYLFVKLILALAEFSKISFFVDDLHNADIASLELIGKLISDAGSSIFFAFSYRDDEESMSREFTDWLNSAPMGSMEILKLQDMNTDNVNSLLSDSLHRSPRVTRPLASVLHQKTRGNPLFLRQLIESLKEQGHIYVDPSRPKWSWNLNKISDMEMSTSVVTLLVKEMQALPPNLQFGLKVASCCGSRVKCTIVEILSKEMDVDLVSVLQQVCMRGFMVKEGVLFRFLHDKIEEAAYELMPEEERREYHMRFGLALFAKKLSTKTENDELFFAAINQANRGGPTALRKPEKKILLAGLNLKAGKRAKIFSDYRAAFKLFQHGIQFLEGGHWKDHYKLSLDLFDSAAESACMINDKDAVDLYSKQVVAHAKCYEDKANSLVSSTRLLLNSEHLMEHEEASFTILAQMGEEHPRPLGDASLDGDIQVMKKSLQNISDDSILSMNEATSKKTSILLKMYFNLTFSLQFTNPSLKADVTLRMVDITIKSGLSEKSSVAFACYAEVLASMGEIIEACRFGRLALKILENKRLGTHKSSVIFTVCQTVMWAFEPLQSIAEAHLLGKKAGEQSGDFAFSSLNRKLSVIVGYIAGARLDTVRGETEEHIETERSTNNPRFGGFMIFSVMCHSHAVALIEGLHVLEADHISNIPTYRVLLAKAPTSPMIELQVKIYALERAYLFRQTDEMSNNAQISQFIAMEKHQLNPLYIHGVFFEGLASFHLARVKSNERDKWIMIGETALGLMRRLREHSSWNWESKMLMLEAERMHVLYDNDEAASFHEKAIISAREHQFINDEAIASENAGMYYCRMGLHQKSSDFLLHSIKRYKKWGAFAVAMRVEMFVESRYGENVLAEGCDESLGGIFEAVEGLSKKRRNGD